MIEWNPLLHLTPNTGRAVLALRAARFASKYV